MTIDTNLFHSKGYDSVQDADWTGFHATQISPPPSPIFKRLRLVGLKKPKLLVPRLGALL